MELRGFLPLQRVAPIIDMQTATTCEIGARANQIRLQKVFLAVSINDTQDRSDDVAAQGSTSMTCPNNASTVAAIGSSLADDNFCSVQTGEEEQFGEETLLFKNPTNTTTVLSRSLENFQDDNWNSTGSTDRNIINNENCSAGHIKDSISEQDPFMTHFNAPTSKVNIFGTSSSLWAPVSQSVDWKESSNDIESSTSPWNFDISLPDKS